MKKKLNVKKLAFLTIFIVIISAFFTPLVFAANKKNQTDTKQTEGEKKVDKKKCTEAAISNKYKPDIDQIDSSDDDESNDKVRVSINPKNGYKNIKFEFESISDPNLVSPSTLAYLERTVLSESNDVVFEIETDFNSADFTIVYVAKKDDKDGCVDGTLSLTSEGFKAPNEPNTSVEFVDELAGFTVDDKDDDGIGDPKSVGQRFMTLWEKAFRANYPSATYNNFDSSEKYVLNALGNAKKPSNKTLKCSYKVSKDETTEYYTEDNTKYLLHSYKEPPIKINYLYDYAPGDLGKSGDIEICTRTCSEALEVQYGAPVASKAGFCFEYKVKVNSIVRCHTDIRDDAKPVKVTNYCLPNPQCYHAYTAAGVPTGATIPEGGPNDDFDDCVDDCDGGKYSPYCSQKCYKRVYGSSSSSADTELALYSEDALASKMAFKYENEVQECVKENEIYMVYGTETSSEYPYYRGESGNEPDGKKYGPTSGGGGCYYWKGNNIKFRKNSSERNGGKGDPGEYGRWFIATGFNLQYNFPREGDGATFCTVADGIKRAVGSRDRNSDNVGNWSICGAACFWRGCKKGQYLNKGNIEKDYHNNVELYKDAINKCKAKATCTEKTATFTISANYGDETNSDWVKFPQGYASDSLTSPAVDRTVGTSKEDDTTIIDSGEETCYGPSRKNDREYFTEWTFPGTWIENKTGQMSYVNPGKNGWYQEKKQFCLRFDAKDVNQKWWNYYMSVKYGKGNTEHYDYEDTDYTKECSKNAVNTTSFSGSDANDINWNIKAITKNFGYFGWNIEMRCFFAVNGDSSTYNEKKDDINTRCNADLNYRVRSVDNEDLFPDPEGNPPADKKEITGREPGFNWTSAATLTSSKTQGTVAGSGIVTSTGSLSGTGSEDESSTVDYEVARGYNINPANLIKMIQNKGNDIYNGTDCLQYTFHLTPTILKDIKSDNATRIKYDYTKFTGDYEYDNGYGYYISDLFRNSSHTPKEYAKAPAVSNLGRNNGIGLYGKKCYGKY